MGIATQPDFPKEDLTEENAALLELLLSNEMLVAESHATSEQMSWVFKVGHKVVNKVSGSVLDHDNRFEALDHGAAVYEAMSLLLAAVPTRADGTFVVQAQAAAWLRADSNKLIDYQEEAYAAFNNNLPRAKEVVGGVCSRFYPRLTNYAILGAAMAHQFELDTAA